MRFLLLSLLSCILLSFANARPHFNTSEDLLLAHFDSKPDPDDIHAQAALGCILAHPSYADVNYFAVAGAVGYQNGDYIDSSGLFDLAFGEANWADAHADWNSAVVATIARITPILKKGGKVWVQEAGQSDFTADWIAALIEEGIPEPVIKKQVIVVQHSDWNEKKTTPEDLAYVKEKAFYQAIDDGNGTIRTGTDRGPDTAQYLTKNTEFMPEAKNSPNQKARELWIEADRVCDALDYKPSYSQIPNGGLDFSDCVENVWILDIPDVGSVGAFWEKFVLRRI